MDGQTLFHRTLLTTAQGLIKNFDSLPTTGLIERYNFYFQILIKRKIPGQKKYFPGFQKIFLDFPHFPGHTIRFQVFPGFSTGNPAQF